VLQAEGYDVARPTNTRAAAGALHAHAGRLDDGLGGGHRRLAARALDGYDYIVTNAGGDAVRI